MRNLFPLAALAALTSGCKGTEIASILALPSDEIATVVTVSWTTDQETTGWVEYGDDYEHSTLETASGTEHKVALLGLTAEETVTFRIVAVTDGGAETVSEHQVVTTGYLPTELPSLSVSGSHDRYSAIPLLGGVTAPVIISPEGEVVWYWFDERELDVYRVRLSNDGESVLYNAASVSGDPAADSVLVRVALDGSSEEEIPVPLLAHDFVEHPDGTLAALATEYGTNAAGEEVRGDKLVEIAPDGTQTTIWTSWDCFDPDELDPGEDGGWTFSNALDYDAENEIYYVGMRNFSSINKIPRATGTCEWSLGGAANTFDFATGSGRFLHQHQFEFLGDTVLVFDNDGSGGTVSRAIEYSFDEAGQAVEEIWSYTADPAIYTFVLGDVARMDNGDTLVDWSVVGQMDRVTPEGEVVWQLNTDIGYALGFNTVVEDLYTGQ